VLCCAVLCWASEFLFSSLLPVVVWWQVDHLGRQLARGAADGEEVAAQRETLLAELAAAHQVMGVPVVTG